MYFCFDCRRSFHSPGRFPSEMLEHFGTPCRYYIGVCPHCGSGEIGELREAFLHNFCGKSCGEC